MPTVWCTAHTASTAPFSSAPTVSARRVGERRMIASAHAACAHATVRKKIPIRRDSDRCSGTTVKWIAAAPPEARQATELPPEPADAKTDGEGCHPPSCDPGRLPPSRPPPRVATGQRLRGGRRSAPPGCAKHRLSSKASRSRSKRSGGRRRRPSTRRRGSPSRRSRRRGEGLLGPWATTTTSRDRVEVVLVDVAVASRVGRPSRPISRVTALGASSGSPSASPMRCSRGERRRR